MIADDKLIADTEEKKNELETFLYDIRRELEEGGNYHSFASPAEREKVFTRCNHLEVSFARYFQVYLNLNHMLN